MSADLPSPVEASIAAMRTAASGAGIGPADPMHGLIEACARVAQGIEQVATVYGAHVEAASTAVSASADKQLAGLRATVEAETAQTTRSISEAIRGDVVKELRGWTRKLDRGLTFRFGLIVIFVGVLLGSEGYVLGRSAGRDEALASSSGVQAELAARPDEAKQWLHLIQTNNILFALGQCSPLKVPKGKACAIPLWLEPPVAGEDR